MQEVASLIPSGEIFFAHIIMKTLSQLEIPLDKELAANCVVI